ncbi:MAG: flagellar motor protein MotB [Treponema sp.]|nr:flagellar motor protein MotB [Treponema sp.]
MGKSKEPEKPSSAWQGTYGDMITLMLCFFVMLYNPSETDVSQLQQMAAAMQQEVTTPADTPAAVAGNGGGIAGLGNSVSALPSLERGMFLGPTRRKAVSLFAPDVHTNRITITSDERGLVITLVADSFFEEGSAELNINDTRDTLLRLASFFDSEEMHDRRFRIEGHTDSTPVPDDSVFPSNWELSAARAANVLHYLADFGVDENQFSIAGYADTRPQFDNSTEEQRAYNRRVDIIILDEGHF